MDKYKPKLISLCHPHNPSGKIFKKDELDFIIKKASQYGTYILSDEIMADFTLYPPEQRKNATKFISLVNYSYERILVGNSISKIFNTGSVQGGFSIIKDKSVRDKYL